MSLALLQRAGHGDASRPLSNLTGRRAERRALLRAAENPPSVVFLEGEAGAGKTSLLEELLASSGLAPGRSLVGSCHPAQDPFPLGPLVEALRGLGPNVPYDSLGPVAGALRPFLPELAPNLPPAPEPSDSPAVERHRLFRGIHDLLAALGPSVLALEDLHWADSRTVELLQFLLARPPANVSLILTFRPEQPGAREPVLALAARIPREVSREIVALPPLSREEVGEFAGVMLARGKRVFSEQIVRDLHEWTGGNPLAVKEVTQHLLDRSHFFLEEGCWRSPTDRPLEVPPVFRDSLLQRFALLEAPARLIGEAASVLVTPASEGVMAGVAGLSPSHARRGLSEALATRFIRVAGEGLFVLAPPLARQAVYEAIPTPERRVLHLRAAKALEVGREPLPLGEIADHFKRAGKPRLWLRYAEQAAEAASSLGDDLSAVDLLEEAFYSPYVSFAAKARLAVKLGAVALFARLPYRGIRILKEALEEEALQPGVRGEVRFSLARLLYQTGDSAAGYREMVRSADELRRRPGPAAWVMANLAATWPTEGGADEDRLWLGRALEAAASQDDPVVETHVLASRAVVLMQAGDPAGWRAVEEIPWDAGSTDQAVELVRAHKYLARIMTLLGHYKRAEASLERADRIRSELGNERFGVGLATTQVELDWHIGRWNGLEERARGLIEASGEARVMSGRNELITGWLLLSRGQLEEAERILMPVLEALRSSRTEALIAATAD